MSENIIEEQPASKADQWRERIAEQQRSGLSIKQFCKQQGIAEHSFYDWRKRLREKPAVRFALVDRASVGRESLTAACLEPRGSPKTGHRGSPQNRPMERRTGQGHLYLGQRFFVTSRS